MKTIAFFSVVMFAAVLTYGQQINLNEVKVTAPEFRSEIYNDFHDFLKSGIEYPEESIKAGHEGTEIIQFTITTTGEITNFKVINSVSDVIDMEVIRVLKITDGMWAPRYEKGERVAVDKEITLVFKISEKSDFVKMAKACMNKANELIFIKNKPKKALKYLNEGIKLLPNEEALLASRSLCCYVLGDLTTAEHDWARLKKLNDENEIQAYIEIDDKYKSLPGYEKMLIETAK